MRKFIAFFSLILVLSLALSGCSQPSATPASGGPAASQQNAPRVTPQTGKSSLAGVVPEAATLWPGEEVYVYAASFVSTKDGKGGFYTLQPSLDPSAEVKDGNFQLTDLRPGLFVLIVGPSPSDGKVIYDEAAQKPLIVDAKVDQIVELGTLKLSK
jgi:hypothetical protein